MRHADSIKSCVTQHFLLDGQVVEYQLVHSRTAKKLRIKVKLNGIDVVVPLNRDRQEAIAFVDENHEWVAEQLRRVRRIRSTWRTEKKVAGLILFNGEQIPITVVHLDDRRSSNKIVFRDGSISILCGQNAQTSTTRSLENWLRKQARESIKRHVADIGKRVKREPNRIYIMDQRTKWGNCSALGNLSFNWRLIMAPEYVLRYIVTHEMVHLAIPDHSQRFWLMVRSLCPSTEKARQWLVANAQRLTINLHDALPTEK